MSRPDLLRDLVRLSFAQPRLAGERLIALAPPIEGRWLGMAAAIIVGTLLAYLIPLLSGRIAEVPPPAVAVGVQGGANMLAVVLMVQVGRMFGGAGRFEDALLLLAWLQGMMALVQLVQIVALLVMPPLAGLVLVLAVGLFFWLMVGFVQALHGFQNPFLVLFGSLAALMTAAFILSYIVIALGFEPPGLTDV
jgi:hypothetical protein